MRNKEYSKVNEIPRGNASNNITNGCLVIEGGAFRSLHTQGVLDCLMLNDINFDTVIGVSAGALSGACYITGQIGRCARINLSKRHNSEYIGLKAYQKTKSLINLDYPIFDIKEEPYDFNTLYNTKRTFIAVATNCLTGKPTYFYNNDKEHIIDGIKASSTMPFISKMINIEDTPYLDGGCSQNIPYQYALQNNYQKIVIIKTRDDNFRVKEKKNLIAKKIYHNYPNLANQLMISNFRYNQELDEIEKLKEDGKVFVIAPKTEILVKRIEGDMEKLGELYWQGYNECLSILPSLMEYLKK